MKAHNTLSTEGALLLLPLWRYDAKHSGYGDYQRHRWKEKLVVGV